MEITCNITDVSKHEEIQFRANILFNISAYTQKINYKQMSLHFIIMWYVLMYTCKRINLKITNISWKLVFSTKDLILYVSSKALYYVMLFSKIPFNKFVFWWYYVILLKRMNYLHRFTRILWAKTFIYYFKRNQVHSTTLKPYRGGYDYDFMTRTLETRFVCRRKKLNLGNFICVLRTCINRKLIRLRNIYFSNYLLKLIGFLFKIKRLKIKGLFC